MYKFYFTLLTLGLMTQTALAQNPVGIFENALDVGPVLHEGSTAYDAETQTYVLKGAGANIWYTKDEMQFAYSKLGTDFIVRARASISNESGIAHRKYGWMVRTSLDTTSVMVTAMVHGDGTTAIQYRKVAGENVVQIKSPVLNPDIIQLERRGQSFFFSVAKFGDTFWTVEVPDFSFPDEVLAGLFVCSHDANVVETATFENVRIVVPADPDFRPYQDYIGSHIELMDLETCTRRIIHTATNSLQAPNWTVDGKSLLYNSEGLIYKLDLASGDISEVPTDYVNANNNDHVLSFDGEMLGLSSKTDEYNSVIYTVPTEGGVPKQITPVGPSYLHGWSPDRKWLTFIGGRDDIYNIYKIRSDGSGEEIALTNVATLDDGPEYSPDGEYIYWNSARTGTMELWRMRPDGSDKEQLTDDDFQNWFPHLSPDGKTLVFVSFPPEVPAAEHPFYQHVYLRQMPANGGRAKVIAYIYGGQGTINVPSWSPDGRYVAFVSNTVVEE